ncbi:heparinase II/III-family protein [Brevundimonas sp. BR2-1]|uniref:heparinase II/III family protein n=1 Tax=Brevundimonas sp. BR2-1 TaxID=3031123 RepID=UPI0030A9039B
MRQVWTRLRTLPRLGLLNLARVGAYRLAVRAGVHAAQRITANPPVGPFFPPRTPRPSGLEPSARWRDSGLYFGWSEVALVDGVPAWHTNPFSGRTVADANRPWWKVPDFDPDLGDIKTIWEPSRFDWLISAAQRAKEGDPSGHEQIERWLADWLRANPPYLGPNWKCGQEASIRVMHIAMAALMLDQGGTPSPGLRDMVELHLRRIAPTIGYAVGQDNNHGTSEAAALFVGGSWLARLGVDAGRGWERLGRRWLENRIRTLVEPDGSFSQYSVNYHRIMLDAVSVTEVWRRKWELPAFSPVFEERMRAATSWLHALVDPVTGDAPNIGANDGARLLPLTDTDYRDYRPSLQLAATLFCGARAFADADLDAPLKWLDIPAPAYVLPKAVSRLFDDGGYAVLRRGGALAVLRYPRFRFRPSGADALHLDVWLAGKGLFRDAGSYTYNGDGRWLTYFPGTESHNTVQFDDRDQMPRVGRFLFGDWLRTEEIAPIHAVPGGEAVKASYRDSKGARHERSVTMNEHGVGVKDWVSGFDRKAVLRWRLPSEAWRLTPDGADGPEGSISIVASTPIVRMSMVRGRESRYYMKLEESPVLEVEIAASGSMETKIAWIY